MCIFVFGLSSTLCNSFSMLFIHSDFFMISLFSYSTPKLFCLFCIQLLHCLHTFSPSVQMEVSLVILEGTVLFCFSIILIFLISQVPSDLSLRVLSFVVVVLLFPLCPNVTNFSSVLSFYYCKSLTKSNYKNLICNILETKYMKIGDLSSTLGKSCCVSFGTNSLGKDMNPVFLTAMNKYLRQTGFFGLGTNIFV